MLRRDTNNGPPYHASLGRFISEDPAGFGADVNFYPYVRNNPLNWTDSSGEWIRTDLLDFFDGFNSNTWVYNMFFGAGITAIGIQTNRPQLQIRHDIGSQEGRR